MFEKKALTKIGDEEIFSKYYDRRGAKGRQGVDGAENVRHEEHKEEPKLIKTGK